MKNIEYSQVKLNPVLASNIINYKQMKKMLLILAVACMFSCSDDEQQQDCNCDRVTEANTFNIVGTPQSPAMNYYTVYTTRNECSGEIKQKTYTTTVSTSSPKVGQCR